LRSKQPGSFTFSFGESTNTMQPLNKLNLEVVGISVGAEGYFAVSAVLLTFLVAAAGFLAGRKLGWW
jgi:hypothetical protein